MGQENANEQPPPPPPTFWQIVAERIRNTPGSGLAFAVIPLLILGYLGWYYYGADHLDQTLYSLKLDNIEITPQPPWIRGDVKAKVFHANQLGKVSLLDPQATATIAHAFDAHMWIKNTNHVRKLSSGKVVIDVTYRRPAAMVYCDEQLPGSTSKAGAYAVDEDGVVLDSDEFASSEVHNYFMIFAQRARPAGKVGMSFGDPRINEALLLCKLLENLREPHKLDCIHVANDAVDLQLGGFNSWMLNIVTHDKREIAWGHAPGKETRDEMQVEEKLATMTAWLKTPASQSPVQVLDLTRKKGSPQRLTSTPGMMAPAPGVANASGVSPALNPFGTSRFEVPRPLPPQNSDSTSATRLLPTQDKPSSPIEMPRPGNLPPNLNNPR